MILSLSNKFVKFQIYFEKDIDLLELQNFLGAYGLIKETNNSKENYDLSIYFLGENNPIFKTDRVIIDEHIFKKDNDKLFIGMKNNDEILFIKRVLIDLINRIFENKGGIFLHSSSIVKNGQSTIFIGDKCSGKTTNMLYILNKYNHEIAYSSNERTGLIIKNNEIISYGNPARINIRENTLNLNENLKEKIWDSLVKKNYVFDDNSHLLKKCNERLVISFNDLSKSLDTQIIPTAKLRMICNLIHKPDTTFYAKKIDYNEISDDLKKSIIDGVFPNRILLNDMFENPTHYNSDLLKNERICYYNIYQDGKTDNSEKIYKLLKDKK